MKRFLIYSAVIAAIVAFGICAAFSNNIADEFILVMFYPLLYAVMVIVLGQYLLDKTRSGRITVTIFLVIQFLRAVLLPVLGAISGYFKQITGLLDSNSAALASVLVFVEMIVTFLCACLILRYSRRIPAQAETLPRELSGNIYIYILFVLVAAVLYIWKGEGMYSFFSLDITTDQRASFTEETIGMELSAIISFGLTFLVILLLYWNCRKYQKTGKKRYMYYSLLVMIARICIISSNSEGRLAVLYPTGVALLLLPRLYPRHRGTIVRSVMVVGVAVIGMMTLYKTFHAFLYDSYADALQGGMDDFSMHDAATQIDIYFYGVRNIAKNLYVSDRLSLDFTTMVKDLLRNTFGIHYLFRGGQDTTLELYNLYIYSGELTAGHLYSSLAYGSTYLTPLLAPLATVFNMLLVTGVEKWLRRMRTMDTYYIVGIVYMRMAYNLFACFPLAWNYASRMLLLGFLIIGGASLLKGKRTTVAEPWTVRDGGYEKT